MRKKRFIRGEGLYPKTRLCGGGTGASFSAAGLLISFVFLIISAASVFPGGREDNESHTVENPNGFTESVDIENRKAGKYNFYLEARDKGGNTAIAGPENIYIDPESDLPIVNITNPGVNMHVQGNLNIVGTCVDDDGVGYVELWFNDDPSTVVRAEGAEFWSYYYETVNFPDKLYTISARGVDINGLPGKEVRVHWNLDRKKPEAKVTSHELGALVAGRITLKGTVWDGNGISSLAYSLDGGNHYVPLFFKYDKKNDIYNYELRVDTKTFEDGPAVIWFQTRDNMGTLGAASHLVFVDNTGPDVQIAYPGPEEAVNGIFTVAGSAMDTVGLASLSWKLGKESGEFPLTTGNPWWVKEFDIRGQKARNLDLEIRAVDLSGNVTTAKRKISVDQDADLPLVTLREPQAAAIIAADGRMNIRGSAGDDDGVGAVLYSLDAGKTVYEIPCSGSFQFVVPGISAGIHNLEVWARDITGVEGPKVQVKGIVAPGPAPELLIAGLRYGSGKALAAEDFYTGMEIHPESGAGLGLLVNSGSALTSLSWRFGGNEPVLQTLKNKAGGEYRQDIPLPVDIPYGLVKLELRAVDIHGREGIREEYIYITDLSVPNPDEAAKVQDNSSYGDLRLESLDGQSWRRGGTAALAGGSKTGMPVTALFAGEGQIKSAVFTAGGRQIRGSAKASPSGGWQITGTIPPDLPAGFTSLGLEVITRTNETHQVSGDFFILRPAGDREINTARGFRWASPDGILDGGRILISQAGPLLGLYSGRPLQSAEISGAGAENFRAEVDQYGRLLFQASGEGSFGPVSFNLTDKDGLVYETGPYNFLVDRVAPVIRLDENPEGQWVRNEVGVKFSGGDANRIQALDVSFNLGDTWQPLVPAGELGTVREGAVFERILDISGLEDGAVNVNIRIIDEAGRAAAVSFLVQKDTRPPEPLLVVPVSGARVNGVIRMGIAVKESGKLASVVYRRPAGGTGENPVPEITRVLYSHPNSSGAFPFTFLDVLLDSAEIPLAENMSFGFEDASGNSSGLGEWPFVIDKEMDLPVIELSLPLENEIITSGFTLSGIMYDDDAVKQIYWHIDDGEDQIFEGANGYSVPISLSGLTDNEHTITVSAEDIYGARSAPVTRTIRISLEEPKAQVLLPTFSQIVKETVLLSGVASDENDIKRVQISLDSGNSYNDASGTTGWTYQFSSKILQDGTHVVFVRVWDGYEITALYSSLINIDNTAPEVILESPVDGLVTTGDVAITGRAIDAVLLDIINIEVRSLEGKPVPEGISRRQVKPASILMETLDLSSLSDGIYNIEVWAKDKAENITRVSRNVEIFKDNQQNFVDNLYPLNGEHVQGMFNLYGYTGGVDKAAYVTLSVNDIDAETVEVTGAGYYRFALSGENLREGLNSLMVRSSDFDGEELVGSSVRSLYYKPGGAWVTIDSLNIGDFAYDRPWLTGRSGYALSPAEEEILADKKSGKELRAIVAAKKLDYIDLSFDNGRTFFRAEEGNGKDSDWRYRFETGEMTEGFHYLIVRATMANGETAVTRTLIQMDKTPPWIRLVAPQAGGRYNQSLEYTAFAGDNVELQSLTYYLRKGDKAFYGVPGFLQGVYVESTIPPFVKQLWNGWPNVFAPATYMDLGMGLSFFDDNVKVQLQYGFMTEDLFESMGYSSIAYAGDILGLKLLANLYTLPFGAVIGPDWEWLSASFGLGANFSLFSQTQSESPTWMSALLFQLEFPKVTMPKRRYLRTFSGFTEFQCWFRSTDVPKSTVARPEDEIKKVILHIALGVRMYIF